MIFADRIVASFRKDKRAKRRVDTMSEQVRKVLATADQKLILMVRG